MILFYLIIKSQSNFYINKLIFNFYLNYLKISNF